MQKIQASNSTTIERICDLAIKFSGAPTTSLIDTLNTLPLKLPADNTYYVIARGNTIEIFTQDYGIKKFKYEGTGSIDYNDEKIEIAAQGQKIIIYQNPRALDLNNFKPLEEHLAPVALMEEFAQEQDPLKRRALIEKIRTEFATKTAAMTRQKASTSSSDSYSSGESNRSSYTRAG